MMARCTDCGALLGPGAEWCGQCYALVRRPQPEPAEALRTATPRSAPAPPVSPNGASAKVPPAAAAPATPPLNPELLLSLASSGTSGRLVSMGARGRTWVTAVIVSLAVATDALFFPYVAYMVVYGLFVGGLSALALKRLWSR